MNIYLYTFVYGVDILLLDVRKYLYLFSSFTLTAVLGQLPVIASQVPGSSQMKAREGES